MSLYICYINMLENRIFFSQRIWNVLVFTSSYQMVTRNTSRRCDVNGWDGVVPICQRKSLLLFIKRLGWMLDSGQSPNSVACNFWIMTAPLYRTLPNQRLRAPGCSHCAAWILCCMLALYGCTQHNSHVMLAHCHLTTCFQEYLVKYMKREIDNALPENWFHLINTCILSLRGQLHLI